jgi:translation initiation factor IF-2
MSENKEKKTLSLGTLSLKTGGAASAPASGKKAVVEVKRKRQINIGGKDAPTMQTGSDDDSGLTQDERDKRAAVLKQALIDQKQKEIEEAARLEVEAEAAKVKAAEDKLTAAADKKKAAEAPAEETGRKSRKKLSADELRQLEIQEMERIQGEEQSKQDDDRNKRQKEIADQKARMATIPNRQDGGGNDAPSGDDANLSYRERIKRNQANAKPATDKRRGSGKITVTQALNKEYNREKSMSLAAQKRAREKARLSAQEPKEAAKKVVRAVVVPETITVQELANRMSERSADIVKSLMKMGVMATINQVIDADTAELVVDEFGHKISRVTEADVEIGIEGIDDEDATLESRPPVVTIMGHVDHGKTSLLDAMRQANVVAGEAGGITQHIGAYQILSSTGQKITFLDTPGHAAFSEMRARGANVTDIVILVVAANDSIMPQTVEAINHAKAAGVPLIVAINKIDLPDAAAHKVKQDLLQHEVIVEELSGEVQCVEISAKKRLNLDTLEEAILLQSELLDLKANPNREAVAVVVESKQEQGRGSVATVLIEKGTLHIGDIFVAGTEWGRVRAILDDKGARIKEAIPGQPVEILGLNGTPDSGEKMVVVKDEARAREIQDYRVHKKRENANLVSSGKTGFEALLAKSLEDGSKTILPVLIKGDVHGSVEAIMGSLDKISDDNPDVDVKVLHYGVGGITESDITLAKASNALIIGFNVRANAQARDMAQRDGVDMRYFNVIYNIVDDVKALLSGMLDPHIREEYLGQATIREVFNITKVGKVAGCMVSGGTVKRGSKVRLLRDDVVIHEGTLKTLKRFKDEVKEVKEGMECGMAFENYDDIKANDVIECYDVTEEVRVLD